MDYKDIMKDYRERNGNISQRDMAQRLGIGQQTYSKIETGAQEPGLGFILKYREVTGVNLVESQDVARMRVLVGELEVIVGELKKLL